MQILCHLCEGLAAQLWLSVIPQTVAHQAPLSMEFSRQEYWSGFLVPSLGDLPNPEIKTGSPTLKANSLPSEPSGNPKGTEAAWAGNQTQASHVPSENSTTEPPTHQWAPIDFSIHSRGAGALSWKQSPVDTKGQLYTKNSHNSIAKKQSNWKVGTGPEHYSKEGI